ncbi:MAG: hypothetical protein ABR600_13165 [Actinomycetota bacterium]
MMRRIAACILVLALGACSTASGLHAPATVDDGTYEKVDRTVENELMASATEALEGLGLRDPVGGAYEFLPYKPQFFLGVARGSADMQAVIDAVLPLFGGGLGLSEPPHDVAEEGVHLLCGPYSHTGVPGTIGTGGLASISAVCAWSDGETAGFGIGVAGPSVEDVARMTAGARAEAVG